MISRKRTNIGLPSSVTVSRGQGEGWETPSSWYTATDIGDGTARPASSMFAMADLNDDEMADLVTVTTDLDVLVLYSDGTRFVTAAPAAAQAVGHRRSLVEWEPADAANAQAFLAHGNETAAEDESMDSLHKSLHRGMLTAPTLATAPTDGAAWVSEEVDANTTSSNVGEGPAPYMPSLLSARQARHGLSKEQLARATFPMGAHKLCNAFTALRAWPHAAPECMEGALMDEQERAEDAIAVGSPYSNASRGASRRSLQTRDAFGRASAVWLGRLPADKGLMQCSLHPTGLQLLSNVPGYQLIFACKSGARMPGFQCMVDVAGEAGQSLDPRLE